MPGEFKMIRNGSEVQMMLISGGHWDPATGAQPEGAAGWAPGGCLSVFVAHAQESILYWGKKLPGKFVKDFWALPSELLILF